MGYPRSMAWIVLNDAFLSIVAHRDLPDALLVRARASGHIEAVFPDAEVEESVEADYRYRATLSRREVAEAIAARLGQIDYPNFKNSISSARPALSSFAHEVWGVGARTWGSYGGRGEQA